MGVSIIAMVTLLLIATVGLTNADPMAAYRGQPVLSIDIEAPDDEDVDELRPLIDIQPGFLLSAQDIQASVKRLYALGRFSNVEVSARRLSGVVTLTFRLTPLERLADLEVSGLKHTDEERLLSALGIGPGDEVDRRTRAQLRQRALLHLERVGFPLATVDVFEEQVSQTNRSYRLEIEEGPPRRIAAVEFEGDFRVDLRALRRVVSARPDDILDLDALATARARLEREFLARGFLQATVREPTVSDSEPARVVFHATAGDRIKVLFAGNQIQSDDQLMSLWPEADARLRRETLSLLASRVQEHYARLGYADATARVLRWHNPVARTRAYVIKVHEGEPVRVVDILIHGATAIEAPVLREQIRAVLRTELAETTPLLPVAPGLHDLRTHGRSPYRPVRRSFGYGSAIPTDQRWVPALYADALEGIEAVYRDRGFLSVSISEAKPMPDEADPTLLTVTVDIREGPQTLVHSVRFRGNERVSARALLDVLEQSTGVSDQAVKLVLGSPYSASAMEDGRIAIIRKYRDMGYLYARVFADGHVSKDARHADIVYQFEEGPQVRIRSVLVRGNRHTRKTIVRSRISLEAGDIYRLEQAVRDQRSVAGLGVFSSVRVKLIDEERPEEQKDLVTEVVERNRQPVEVSPGISTADGPRFSASYTHLNLLGTASAFSASGKFNRQVFFGLYGEFEETMRLRFDTYNGEEQFTKAIEHDIRFGVRSPQLSLFPLDPLLRFEVAEERENAIPYSLQSLGASLGVDLFPTRRVRITVEPKISRTVLECPVATSGAISLDTSQTEARCLSALAERDSRLFEEGERRAFEVTPSITVDGRDNPFNPGQGYFATLLAGYTNGQRQAPEDRDFEPFSFVKLEGSVAGYLPILGSVLVLRLAAGTIRVLEGEGVPIDERFFLGGRDTLRGFVEQTLVPQDACVLAPGAGSIPAGCDEVLQQGVDEQGGFLPVLTRGGNTYGLLKTELRIPLTRDVSLDLFVDAGNLWVATPRDPISHLRIGTGAGLRYNTPVGALVLDVGVNPAPRRANSEGSRPLIHFSIGSF